MEEFIDNVKILINVLGYKVLESLIHTESYNYNECIFSIQTGSAKATGKITSEGFVVLKGASINEKTSNKSLHIGMQKLRQNIISSNKVKNFITTVDILFSSSSAAADFILGYSVSGPLTWKTKDGKTLKDFEKAQTEK